MNELQKKACLLYFKHMHTQCNGCIITNLKCTPFHTAIAAGCVDDVREMLHMIATEDRITETDKFMQDTGLVPDDNIQTEASTSSCSDGSPMDNAVKCSDTENNDHKHVSEDQSPQGRENPDDGHTSPNHHHTIRPDTQDISVSCKDKENTDKPVAKGVSSEISGSCRNGEDHENAHHDIKPSNFDQLMKTVSLLEFVLNSPISFMPSMTYDTALTCEYISPIQDQLPPDDLQQLMHMSDFPITLGLYKKQCWDQLMFKSCLGLALGSGNTELVGVLTQDGKCDILQQGASGNSCIHDLVQLCELEMHTAVKMYTTLCKILDTQQLNTLLHLKNKFGYNALEFAAEKSQPEILKAIVNTPDVYRHEITAFGCKRFVLYDVTEYERKNATVANSVLFKLTDMNESQVIRAKKCGLLTSEPFNTWCELKFSSYRLSVYMFFGYWLSFAALFYSGVFIRLQFETAFLLVPMALLFVIIETMFVKSDIKQMVRSYKQLVHDHKIPVTFTLAYRLFQLMFAVGILIMVISYSIFDENIFSLAVEVVNSITGVLSILFFLQLNPSIGHMLIVTQKMTMDVAVFFLTIALLYFGFSVAFYLLQFNYVNKDNNPLTAPEDGVEIDSFPTMSYMTFLLMLSVVSPPEMFFSDYALAGLTRTLFVILVIIVVIVQLNMIIAIMSSRLDEINTCKQEIFQLEKLCIIMYVEQRLNTRLGRWLFKNLKSCRCAWKKKKKTERLSGFTYNADKSKVYLEVVERLPPKP